MANLFFSYSHKDRDLRDELEIHLSALKRQGLISTWSDRRIVGEGRVSDEELTMEGGAEYFWAKLIEPLQGRD